MNLYKYLPPERIDVLRDRCVRYTQPILFNDPFESKPYLWDDIPTEDWQRIAEIEFKRNQLPEEDWLILERLFKPEYRKERMPKALRFMLAVMGSTVGILSLTEKPDSMVMWAHYAASHAGFVLGLDAQHPYFSLDATGTHKINCLRKVQYGVERPNVGLSRTSIIDVYFRKSLDWEYEQEWRIFKDIREASHIIETEPFPICLFDFPPSLLKVVILGCRISERTQQTITNILSTQKVYKHVKLFRAQVDEKQYRLNITEEKKKRG